MTLSMEGLDENFEGRFFDMLLLELLLIIDMFELLV